MRGRARGPPADEQLRVSLARGVAATGGGRRAHLVVGDVLLDGCDVRVDLVKLLVRLELVVLVVVLVVVRPFLLVVVRALVLILAVEKAELGGVDRAEKLQARQASGVRSGRWQGGERESETTHLHHALESFLGDIVLLLIAVLVVVVVRLALDRSAAVHVEVVALEERVELLVVVVAHAGELGCGVEVVVALLRERGGLCL